MKRILFINPPVVAVNDCQRGWYSYAHPTSILKLIAWHKKTGNHVSFIDCMDYDVYAEKPLEFYKKLPLGASNLSLEIDSYIQGKPLNWLKEKLLAEEEPDEVWISCHITFNSGLAHQAISVVREVFDKANIILGGNYPTLFPEDAKKSGATVYSGMFDEALTLFPDYSLFEAPLDYMVFQLDLGCENECSHCVNHKLIQEIVRFDVDKLVEDIEFKHKNYNVSNFVNIDPNTAYYDLEIFLEKIIEKRLDINLFFYGGIQPDKVTKRLVSLMKQAHVKGMTLPRELDNSLNKQLKKKYTSRDFHRAIKLFKQEKYDFSDFHCAFPFALKDDCLFEIASIIKEVREIGAIPEIAPIAFIPGTVEYNRHYEFLKGKNLEELNWALWPTLDSAEKIQTYALYYNLAHGNRFKAPWRVKSWHIYNAAGAGHQIVLF